MPFQRDHYPDDWEQIRQRILERDGHKCKWCGVKNYAVGARDRNGQWHDEHAIHHMNSDAGYALFGEFPKMIRIVLTTAHHPDPDPANCADDNLQALCQSCHNRADAPMRARNAAATRRRKREQATGQLRLVEV